MAFKNVTLPSAKRVTGAEATVVFYKSDPNWVRFAFRGSVLKKLGAEEGGLVTPLADMKEHLVLFLVKSDRPNGAERKLRKKGASLEVEFPRKDEFAKLFQGKGGTIREMKIIELGPERIVFEGGLVFGEKES